MTDEPDILVRLREAELDELLALARGRLAAAREVFARKLPPGRRGVEDPKAAFERAFDLVARLERAKRRDS